MPFAGLVDGTSFNYVGSLGYYWSGTAYSSTSAFNLNFNSGNVYGQNSNDRNYGFPVRLVAE